MHTRASNSERVEPLAKPERILNLRLRRRNKRVPFEQRDERPENPREVYLPVIDINHFHYFLNLFEIHHPMANPDNEPMWAADHVIAPTPGPGEAKTWLDELNEVFLDKQVGDMSTHNRTYDAPYHTKKNFANMKKEGKGFSRKVTPLFQTMMVQAQKEMGEGSDMPTDPYYIPIITQPSTSQPKKKQKPRKSMKQNTKVSQLSGSTTDATDENVPTHSNDPLLSSKDRLQLKELLEHCTKLSERVLHLETAKTAQAKEIASLKKKVKQLQKKKRSRTHMLKKIKVQVGFARMVDSSKNVLDNERYAEKEVEVDWLRHSKAKGLRLENLLKKEKDLIYI
ncbi:hypothetical protein Tco_0892299 [Tanacetum coccineum]|uniref:Uncharacterized protein n=1 Tax=Tanacetum coccineum TaxID=301880 RepID=A0ABQ5C8I2_9ASTR